MIMSMILTTLSTQKSKLDLDLGKEEWRTSPLKMAVDGSGLVLEGDCGRCSDEGTLPDNSN